MRASGPALVGALALAGGCASSLEMRVRDVDLSSPRIVAFPPHVLVFELDVSGRALNTASSAAGQYYVGLGVARWVAARGGAAVDPRQYGAALPDADALMRWLDQAIEGVMREAREPGPRVHLSVSEWRWKGDLARWRATLGADYVLGFRAWDEHETAGRTALNFLFRPTAKHGQEVDIGCLLSLVDGRLVSCALATPINTERRYLLINDANLEAAGSAQTEVDYVLRGLFPPYEPIQR
jgi:hypothetical protein